MTVTTVSNLSFCVTAFISPFAIPFAQSTEIEPFIYWDAIIKCGEIQQ